MDVDPIHARISGALPRAPPPNGQKRGGMGRELRSRSMGGRERSNDTVTREERT